MIRLGDVSDINVVLDITKSCATYLIQNGIYQWNEYYPDQTSFLNDIENRELYVYTKERKVVACISLCNKIDEIYLAAAKDGGIFSNNSLAFICESSTN